MKKIILFLVAMFYVVALNAQTITEQDYKYWNSYIESIAKIESGRNPNAVSKSGKYVGYLQEATCIVDDVNQYLGKKVYKYSDRYDKQKSIEMFIYIQKRYNPTNNPEKAIRIWCGGVKGHKDPSTLTYYNKVMKVYKQTVKLLPDSF